MEFIYECDDVFPVDFCNRVIDKFEKSNLKMTGCTGGDFVHPIKQSTDVRIYDEPEWVEEEKYFHVMIRKAMKNYETFLLKMDVDDEVKEQMSQALKNTYIDPPQIQRTKPGQYYHWHHDQVDPPNWQLFTYIIYLNDVEKKSLSDFLKFFSPNFFHQADSNLETRHSHHLNVLKYFQKLFQVNKILLLKQWVHLDSRQQ